jgi:hypothetical protein
VTAPDTSALQRQATALLERLSTAIIDMPFGAAAEVMLRRDPSEDEVSELRQALHEALRSGRPARRDLLGLARVDVSTIHFMVR